MLLKVRFNEDTRTEIMDIAKVFNAKIVDLASQCLTLEVTGEPEKILALEQLLQKFGVIEIAKTGKIALLRYSTNSLPIQYIG
jgi:acetolactate synthase-1/3 small subunit